MTDYADLIERLRSKFSYQDITAHDQAADVIEALVKQCNAAVLAEREACARVCEARYMGDNNREDMEAKRCAAAIRARGGEMKIDYADLIERLMTGDRDVACLEAAEVIGKLQRELANERARGAATASLTALAEAIRARGEKV